MPSTLSPFHPILRPFFTACFPHKLKHHFLRAPDLRRRLILTRVQACSSVPFGTSKFSTRSGRERMGSGFGQGGRAGSSKSLIEDEAELSDWVSGLNSSSFKKTRMYSDSENDEDGAGNGGFRGEGYHSSSDLELPSRREGRARLGDSSSGRRKNADDSNSSSFGGRGRGREFSRGGKKRDGKRGFVVSDDEDIEEEEEEKDKGYMNFKGLIDSDEEDEDEDEDEDEGEEVEVADELFEKGNSFSLSPQSASRKTDSYLSESRFDQCPISPLSLKAIKDAGYEKMTLVQEATLPVILKASQWILFCLLDIVFIVQKVYDKDNVILKKGCAGQGKNWHGKTVAFLLPAIELIVKSPPVARDQKRPPILVLVICPTRELASQAAAEANTLLKYHPSIGVQVVIGGTRLALEQKRMQANPCQILVATPGRLRDHTENTSGFATRLMGVKVLVLDEADHLLDMGFRKEIEKIIAAVPKQRQTLLFLCDSSTRGSPSLSYCIERDHEFINTVEEGSEDTHAQVRQMHLVAPLDKHFSLLYTLLKEHIADDVNYKILVFCTTAMVTRLVAELLGELNLNVREIHSRKPQGYRTRISDEFRKSKGLILVTSDVSARGVDYPDVTLVIQIGVPADRQQYIHRLGRTGRKGREGQGILLLAPWEEFFLSSIKDLPISKALEPLVDPETRKKVERALAHVEMKNKEAAYQAWLGYYNSNKNVGRDKYRLVELANEFSRSMGLDNPPAIPKLVLGKMGLKNIPGLRSK
ncbi:DEAD-box ATP-dependent RNA helicase 31 [Sesamum angolense]|uniref:ATP-dependent RNA helicase n=1 Tax=Sesamum angolense TaxID=2727404 RepID=A0AAE1XGE9_9LAMI|nr:DEAD-box ATP-dependent RNA helicase 31 [Sesamum angolense]